MLNIIPVLVNFPQCLLILVQHQLEGIPGREGRKMGGREKIHIKGKSYCTLMILNAAN